MLTKYFSIDFFELKKEKDKIIHYVFYKVY